MNWLYDNQTGHVDWRWIVTAVVACYGAALATYREYAAWRDKTPNLRVRFFTSMIMINSDGTNSPYIQILIENHGRSELTFDSNCASLRWRGSETRLVVWDKKVTNVSTWPHRLPPGASFYIMSPTDDLREVLKQRSLYQNTELQAIVSDAIGRQFFSKWAVLPSAS
jgi:hypothetical protein